MNIQKFISKPISYSPIKRKLTNIEYIVIHNTGNNNDTAWNNAKFFAISNTRQAGAHFFVDQAGNVVQSIEMDRTAYAVGGFVTSANGAASYYKKCTNANSVSIELCDIIVKEPSEAMIKSTMELIEVIRMFCPNAKTILRHWDVSGKSCPAQFVDNSRWRKLVTKIEPLDDNKYGEILIDSTMVVMKDSYLRTSPEVAQNKVAYNSLSATLKKKCRKDDKGYAVFKKDETFTRIRSYKADNGDRWKQMKSGFWLPSTIDGVKRIKEV